MSDSHRCVENAAGTAWHLTGLVFDRGDGQRLSVNAYNLAFHKACERLQLPRIRPHDLWHGAATLMLTDAGLPMLVVSRMNGHAGIGTTADTYEHVSIDMQLEAAQRVEVAVWGVTAS